MENLTNNSLKEYYVKLLEMYNNALSMINAMNQALSTSSSEVSVTLVSGDDTETTLRIPSMLYLENKVEQLQNNFESLFIEVSLFSSIILVSISSLLSNELFLSILISSSNLHFKKSDITDVYSFLVFL